MNDVFPLETADYNKSKLNTDKTAACQSDLSPPPTHVTTFQTSISSSRDPFHAPRQIPYHNHLDKLVARQIDTSIFKIDIDLFC